MIDNSIIKLEDGFEYKVVDKIDNNNCAYVYLVNLVDKEDLIVRKEIVEDENTYLVGLDNTEELEKALRLYLQKNN